MNIDLPALPNPDSPPLEQVIGARRSCRDYAPDAVGLEQLARLLWAAQGETGTTGQQATPSAGAQYPLEIYVVAGRVENLLPGAYRYRPGARQLQPVVETDLREVLGVAALDTQPWVQQAALVLVISADFAAMQAHFQEQPPQAERGQRYVYLESGAMAQNIGLQATGLGLGTVIVGGFDDSLVSHILQLQAPFEPALLVCVGVPA